jgi:hypothetical protein
MSQVVFILGAGASKKAGAPLMAEFLDVAKDLWSQGRVREVDDSFRNVFRAVGCLQQVHSKSEFDIHNVESVFAAAEMGKTLNKFPGYAPEEIDRLIKDLKVVITKTIELTLQFPMSGTVRAGWKILPPDPYDSFAKTLEQIQSKAHPQKSVSIITFNYDVAVDLALYMNSLDHDYCLQESSLAGKIPLLKLHGSLNWARHKESEAIIPWTIHEYLSSIQNQLQFEQYVVVPIGSQLNNSQHSSSIIPEPEIVPPTWNKADYHRVLSRIWSQAAKELGEADNIFVIGYSLPKTDTFFKFLFALGSVSKIPLRRFWVFNPEPSDFVRKRFKNLLGPGARDRFRYFRETFDSALSIIENEFPERA